MEKSLTTCNTNINRARETWFFKYDNSIPVLFNNKQDIILPVTSCCMKILNCNRPTQRPTKISLRLFLNENHLLVIHPTLSFYTSRQNKNQKAIICFASCGPVTVEQRCFQLLFGCYPVHFIKLLLLVNIYLFIYILFYILFYLYISEVVVRH